jgi:hypothetical protein
MEIQEIDYINKPFKKFIETLQFGESEWEVETPDGWVDIQAIGKTVEYDVWKIVLDSGKTLKCADKHIMIKNHNNSAIEYYTMDLKPGDQILTKDGWETVISAENTLLQENMFDIEIDSKTKLYYTNDIVSHNSIWLANLAASSVRSGYNTAYISLEMRDRKVVKRLGANLLGIKMSEYNKLAHDKVALKAKINNIGYETMKQPGQLYVKEFPTSTASVLDVERYLLKMEEIGGIKFKTVFIDYINIMKNWRNPNTENLYMKIKQIAEDMRAMAMRNDWAIVTATQVNRSGFDSTDLSMNNVSESAALIHTIDAMFGIIQDPIMHANREYILKLLANRDDGHKNAKRKFDINYDFMRITEDPNSEMWSDE